MHFIILGQLGNLPRNYFIILSYFFDEPASAVVQFCRVILLYALHNRKFFFDQSFVQKFQLSTLPGEQNLFVGRQRNGWGFMELGSGQDYSFDLRGNFFFSIFVFFHLLVQIFLDFTHFLDFLTCLEWGWRLWGGERVRLWSLLAAPFSYLCRTAPRLSHG